MKSQNAMNSTLVCLLYTSFIVICASECPITYCMTFGLTLFSPNLVHPVWRRVCDEIGGISSGSRFSSSANLLSFLIIGIDNIFQKAVHSRRHDRTSMLSRSCSSDGRQPELYRQLHTQYFVHSPFLIIFWPQIYDIYDKSDLSLFKIFNYRHTNWKFSSSLWYKSKLTSISGFL